MVVGGRCTYRPARYAETLISHPSIRTDAPRANAAPQLLPRRMFAIHRPNAWAFASNSPETDVCDITTAFYFGGA